MSSCDSFGNEFSHEKMIQKHELPNSSSNINEDLSIYYHFENK